MSPFSGASTANKNDAVGSAPITTTATTTTTTTAINAISARYCYLDLDCHGYRSQLATMAAFCAATDARYGLSSPHLLRLGGSEVARLPELVAQDYEWCAKIHNRNQQQQQQTIQVRPPSWGHRLIVQLHWDVAPLACENFATLCANGSNSSSSTNKRSRPAPVGASGKPLTYRGSSVHRIVPGFVLQGGDFVFGNGSGGEPAIHNGKKFKDERAGLLLKHNRRGLLSMGNSGKHSNGSQWFFTLANNGAPQCDGKHVIFGELVSGWEVLAAAEQLGSEDGTPTGPVVVTDCGLWVPPGCHRRSTPGAGYWYDPPDPDAPPGGVSSVFVVRPRVVTVSPNDAVRDKFRHALAVQHVIQAELLCCCSRSSDNTGSDDNEASVVAQQLHQMLQKCAVDLIVVAPSCPVDALASELTKLCTENASASSSPSLIQWRDSNDIGSAVVCQQLLDRVLLTAKPLEAVRAIRTKSWLVDQSHWQLDGTL